MIGTNSVSAQPARPGANPSRPRTALIGRDEELTEISALVVDAPLVTLIGPGGAGKTRLALAVLRAGDGFDASAWAELADLRTEELVAESVAQAVGATAEHGRAPADRAATRISASSFLLVLDNCEHLIGACAHLVDALLDRCPGLRILATSREPLAVAGEIVRPVPPLSLPPRGTEPDLEAVTASSAGQLFEQRARALVPDFRVTDDNAASVAAVCRRLGGLPLAIELAAARMRVLSVAQISAGLDDALHVLGSGSRSGPARHRTLRAALDWSHDLLDEPERILFRRLAVFPGGFDLVAAEQVAAGGALTGAEILDQLGRLVDRSLVTMRRHGDTTRYRLPQPVRGYATERLISAGEQDDVAAAHLRYFCELTETLEPELTGPRQVAVLDHLEAEANNLRVALAYARDHGATTLGIRLAAALWRLCALRGHYREGRDWLDWAATVDAEVAPSLRAKALRGGGGLAFLECDYPAAVRRLEASLQLYRSAADRAGIAAVLQVLGGVAREQGRYARAESLHTESLELYTALGDRAGQAQSRGYLAFAAWLQGEWTRAVEYGERALTDFRGLGDAEGTVWSLISLGTVAQYVGDFERSSVLLEEARAVAASASFPEGVAWSTHELGLLALRRDDPNAEQLLADSLSRHRVLGDRWRQASVLADLAGAALARGAVQRAATLLGAAASVRDEIGTVPAPCERPELDRVEHTARESLGADRFAAAWTAGHDLPMDTALAVEDAAESPDPSAPQAATVGVATPAADRLRIAMLGASTVHIGRRLVAAADWGYAKPRELFFLLASGRGRSKEQIGLALWPDLDGAGLRNAFHTALRDLRRALGDPGWVVYANGRYAIDRSRDYTADLDVFESSLAAAREGRPARDALAHLQRAIAAYGGDFLPDLPDAEWAQERRTALRQEFTTALAAAGRMLAGSNRLPEAAELYRRAITQDPLDESAHRGLMQSLAALGEPGKAVLVYRELARRLRDDLGIDPAAETTAMYRRLGQVT